MIKYGWVIHTGFPKMVKLYINAMHPCLIVHSVIKRVYINVVRDLSETASILSIE